MHKHSGDAAVRVRKRWSAAFALLGVVVALGGASASSAREQPPGPPDTYVAAWDAIGTQAYSASGLTFAEGHVIFAYVAIAVYDAVMAIEGGHEPFAVAVDVPSTRRAGGRGRRRASDSRALFAGAGADDPRPCVHRVASDDSGWAGEDKRRLGR